MCCGLGLRRNSRDSLFKKGLNKFYIQKLVNDQFLFKIVVKQSLHFAGFDYSSRVKCLPIYLFLVKQAFQFINSLDIAQEISSCRCNPSHLGAALAPRPRGTGGTEQRADATRNPGGKYMAARRAGSFQLTDVA